MPTNKYEQSYRTKLYEQMYANKFIPKNLYKQLFFSMTFNLYIFLRMRYKKNMV